MLFLLAALQVRARAPLTPVPFVFGVGLLGVSWLRETTEETIGQRAIVSYLEILGGVYVPNVKASNTLNIYFSFLEP